MQKETTTVPQSANVEAAVNNFLVILANTMPREEATVALDHLAAFMAESPDMFRKLFSANTIGKIKTIASKGKKPSILEMANLAMEIAGDFK
jgi:hypothetical protein